MNARSILLLLIAFIAVVMVVVLSRNFFKGVEKQAAQKTVAKPMRKILVASKTLNIGKVAEMKDFLWVSWPEKAIRPEYITEQGFKASAVAGQVVRHTIVKGAPATRTSLISAKDKSTTAAVITPGMRAFSVPVNAQTGVAGFAYAGDRVDVILTHVFEMPGRKRFPVSETVLQNVRVLGLDGRGFGTSQTVKAAKTATLEVTPKMAEKLALITRLGTLSLSLRALQEKDGMPKMTPIGETLSGTWGADVSKVLLRPDQRNERSGDEVTVIRGSVKTVQKTDTSQLSGQQSGEQ